MKVTLDGKDAAAAYSKAFRHLTTLPGFEPRAVLRAEAGSILKRWAGVTKVAKPEEATWRARYRTGKHVFGNLKGASKNQYRISVNTGLRGGEQGWVWYLRPGEDKVTAPPAGIISDSGQFTPNHIHWKAADWARISAGAQAYAAELAKLLPAARKSVGFSRQAVVQIADSLNIDLNMVKGGGISAAGIAKARVAIASTGKSYNNGTGYEGGDKVKTYVQLLCTLPHGIKIGMDKDLARVLSGRAKFIETAYAKGAFDSLKKAEKLFPNILKVAA